MGEINLNKINLNGSSGGGGSSIEGAVSYNPQILTEVQQMQARANQGLYYKETPISDTLEWDGDTTGRLRVLNYYYLILNIDIDPYSLIGTKVNYTDTDGEHTIVTDESSIYQAGEGLFYLTHDVIISIIELSVPGLTIHKGIYFGKNSYGRDVLVNSIVTPTPIFQGETIIHQIPEEYVPNVFPEAPTDGKTYGRKNEGWTEVVEKQINAPLKFTAVGENSTLGLSNRGGNAPVVFKSSDEETWEEWDYSSISLSDGESVYIKGNNPDGFSLSASRCSYFTGAGQLKVSGNITSLIGDFADSLPIMNCFIGLFLSNTAIIDASELQLPYVSTACYMWMFSGCTNLINAPETLPATALKQECYHYMFNGCTSLVNAPVLAATTLGTECYKSMFGGCTSLAIAPELPASTLVRACYAGMFSGCTSLVNAPELPATTLEEGCYTRIFEDCSLLNEVTIKAIDISADGCITNWLDDTAANGIILCDASMVSTFEADENTPDGWTVETFPTIEGLSEKVTELKSQVSNKEDKNIIDSDTSTTTVSEAMVVGKTYKYMPSAGVATLAFTLTSPTETDVVKFWRFKFKSGATATEFTPPSGLYWADGESLVPEANTIYEIMIDEDYCVSVLSFKQTTA